MIIAGIYSFNGGHDVVKSKYSAELEEIERVIASINCEDHKSKISKEKTMLGKVLYKPSSLNKVIKLEFAKYGWLTRNRVQCKYPVEYYTPAYQPLTFTKSAYREMDFIKNRLGVEVQFGKYAFMVYNVCAKMTIFHNLGMIDVGVEIVPVKEFAKHMSTGVSYFEQFVWDLQQRGVADIDIPVLILGIAADNPKN
jgi:Restriction endonuclease BglII